MSQSKKKDHSEIRETDDGQSEMEQDQGAYQDQQQASSAEQAAGSAQQAGNARQQEEAPEQETSAESDRIAELEARVSALESENSELKEQYLRKQADFDNFRKRMQREKEEAARVANKDLMLDILPVIDDFERAIKSAEESRDFDAFHDGVKMIEKQFTGMLERKWGLQRFDSEGEEFDPQKHEAVAAVEDPNLGKAVVLEDYQKGYFLHDKVLRSAMVRVAVPSGNQESGTGSTEEQQDSSGAESENSEQSEA